MGASRNIAQIVGAWLVLGAAACSGGGSGGTSPSAPFPKGTLPPQEQPTNVVGNFSIDLGDPALPPSVLNPGDEVFPCFIFPLDLTGPSHLIGGAKLTASVGMHHGNILTRPATGTGIRPCSTDETNAALGGEAFDVLSGGAVLFASTTQITMDEWRTFPKGMGFRIKDGYEIVAHMHYLNATSQVLTVAPKYEWYTVDESTITQELYPFFWELSNFSIPPHTQQTFVGACDFPNPMRVVNALAHMHQLGVGLDVGFFGGQYDRMQWFTTPGYNPNGSLQLEYQPAVDLSTGNATGISMSCTWNNTTDQTVVEGVGVNEMCMIFGYGYPQTAAYSARMSPGNDPRYCARVLPP